MINKVSYHDSLIEKEILITDLFKYDIEKIKPIVKCEDYYNYRHKVIATFGYNSSRKVISGIYEHGTHNLIDLNDCMIQSKVANSIIKDITSLANKFRVPIYNEDKRTGILRHVLVRVSEYTDEVLVSLVLGSSKFPSRKNFVKEIVKKHPEITTVTSTTNNRKTSVVLGDKVEVVYGPGFIYDSLNGYRFKISTTSFYQINPKQTELLYQLALDNAGLKKNDVLLDTYAGIGTIGMIASNKVQKVISVELNKESYSNAISSVRLNKITNIDLVNQDASKYLVNAAYNKEKIDVVIMDPTRNGSTIEFMNGLLDLKPRTIVYISCNPITQSRDLKFIKKDYQVQTIIPVDLFPFTNHVESIVVLQKK
jgi:23S rRNA (uracil1939-C5)-methyltransferase